MNHASAWRDIVDASNLTDLAQERHEHDLLDTEGIPNAPLAITFAALCRRLGVKNLLGVEPVLRQMRTIPGFEGLRVPDEVIAKVLERDGTVVEKPGIAHHTSLRRGTYRDNWGTPQEILEIVRDLYGPIYLDLASSKEANKTVQAKQFYSLEDPCPSSIGGGGGATLWCNPPGPCSTSKEFWRVWCGAIMDGARGGFLIFNLDHWRQLPPPPRPMIVVVLRKRLKFVGAPQGGNFPSALVLSGDQAPEGHGHVVVWEPGTCTI